LFSLLPSVQNLLLVERSAFTPHRVWQFAAGFSKLKNTLCFLCYLLFKILSWLNVRRLPLIAFGSLPPAFQKLKILFVSFATFCSKSSLG